MGTGFAKDGKVLCLWYIMPLTPDRCDGRCSPGLFSGLGNGVLCLDFPAYVNESMSLWTRECGSGEERDKIETIQVYPIPTSYTLSVTCELFPWSCLNKRVFARRCCRDCQGYNANMSFSLLSSFPSLLFCLRIGIPYVYEESRSVSVRGYQYLVLVFQCCWSCQRLFYVS